MKTRTIILATTLIIAALLINACKSKKSHEIVKSYKQEWTVINVEHYRNGDPIPQVQDKNEWANLKTGAWCYYDNKPENYKKYGRLYNWYAVHDSRGLAPEGWHIPRVKEFKTLELYVGNDGNTLKVKGEGTGVNIGTNTTGFSAMLAGYRNHLGKFDNIRNFAAFWTSEEYSEGNANSLFLNNFNNGIAFSNNNKEYGFSIRGVKD